MFCICVLIIAAAAVYMVEAYIHTYYAIEYMHGAPLFFVLLACSTSRKSERADTNALTKLRKLLLPEAKRKAKKTSSSPQSGNWRKSKH